MTSVFYLYRDAPLRRRALTAPIGAPERYVLFGLDELRDRGHAVAHSLERPAPPPAWSRAAGRGMKAALERAGGYGGDFASVLASLRAANRSDVVFSTVDTVGIPAMLSKRAGLLKPPLVYTAIGLPERLERLGNARVRSLYADALARSACVLAYSEAEADDLRRWLGAQDRETRIEFVPFGVDTRVVVPSGQAPELDVVSVGADPQRDFALLLRVASSLPDVTFHIVTTADRARALACRPANVFVQADLAFAEMKRCLERARVVALPVLENSYSGATTVLLQALALAKPVVVTRTRAIADGYGLVDGESCRLVAPGDEAGFLRALTSVLRDELHARSLGCRGRAHVERELGWDRYVDRLEQLLVGACVARPDGRSRRA